MLNLRQQTFALEYAKDLNATQAAIRAGYSEKTADRVGSRLLGNVEVAQLVKAQAVQRFDRLELTADAVLRELMRLGYADLRDVMEWGPWGVRLKESKDLTDDAARTIESVKVKRRRLVNQGRKVAVTGEDGEEYLEAEEWEVEEMQLKLHGKLGAIEALAKYFKLLAPEGPVNNDNRRQFMVFGDVDKLTLAQLEALANRTLDGE